MIASSSGYLVTKDRNTRSCVHTALVEFKRNLVYLNEVVL